ncbi:phosphoadenosine phosphosulfate reductase [Stackebrandtia nassauensis]|uniref:Phosphoadenosine phosphosulfate reductase n=1 Tax=Stackebrandtia nassauensis (strain DSM 44728 / CIP 108903 / NRRL B-16338 / NBRC 102104 / LLR-40K-21) TaxID=446470 RepID=D3Q2D4_STANL|nr:conserved hypothetical protein [Stackebrandtia nassauensis DSM 44728]
MSPLRVIAYGGGVQSTALLVLAASRRIDFVTFLFSNVGNDSEHPATLDYVTRVAKPFAERHGLALVELERVRRDGTTETLYRRLTREGSRSLPIPVRMSNGAPGTRSCTADFKIKVLGRWLKANGATKDNPATVGIGISLDEMHRVNRRRALAYENPVYPLLEHSPPLRRADCLRIIAEAGLPVPGKSACYFCPFHTRDAWATMARDEPDLFARACHLETILNHRRATLGRDPVYLTRYARPLGEAITPAQDTLAGLADLDDDATCDNGACWT